MGYDARLFSEFSADAVLVIKDIVAFTERLLNAVRTQLPSASFSEGGVLYYDPYTSDHSDLRFGFSKHFRYLYQNEYRFIWRPEDTKDLEPIFVELGPLDDIATVLELA